MPKSSKPKRKTIKKKNLGGRSKSFKDSWLGQVVEFLGNEVRAFEYTMDGSGKMCRKLSGSYEAWLDEQALRERTKLKRALRAAQKQRYIEMREEGNKFLLRFTDDGIISLLKEAIKSTDAVLPNDEVCLVLFDFPVAANTARSFWRRFLKSANFEQIQLSCWQTDKDVTQLVAELVHRLDAKDWVMVFKGKKKFYIEE